MGIRAQVSEANTIACRGTAGISNTPAAAIWALRLIGDAAVAGFSRVQMHASRGFYDPFVLLPDGSVRFRPLWTAMLLVDRLWPAGSRPLRVADPEDSPLHAFAARRPDGSLGVLAVNSDLARSRRLVLATVARRALVGRLDPRGPFTVALDGRRLTWAGGAPEWTGRQRLERIRVHGGRLALRLAPMSAAWVVLDGSGDADGPAGLTAP
jgi:hypothetical protein